jgi:long-chain acyl-CoA synthetase
MLLVQHFLEQSAGSHPNKTALIFGAMRLTYAQVEAMANRLAHALIAIGVKRGDRVAIYLNNSVESVMAIFAALKADAVFVCINRATKEDKLLYLLNNCRVVVVMMDERAYQSGLCALVEHRVPSLLGGIICGAGEREAFGDRPRWRSFDGIQAEFPMSRPKSVNIDLDLACLVYTSGTTGEAKGVMSDHSNITFVSASVIEYLGNHENDIILNVLPLSFSYGLYQLLMTFRFGGTLVLERSFAYPVEILALMEREHVSGFPGVPTMFATLLDMDITSFELSSVRYLTNAAAALPPAHIMALRRKFPSAKLFSMYGLTETKRALYQPPEWLDAKPHSVGIAIPGTEVWIEDEAGNRVGSGITGELVVRGRHVMRGYWEAPEASAQRFRPGPISGERLCYTGDLFRMDEEGCMYFVGRKDDIIKCRGEKVAPREVENVLHELDGVVEAAVVGVPDTLLGQAIKAVIVARKDIQPTSSAILAHCQKHLEDFMIPKIIEFRDALPKSPSGKLRKQELI